MKKLRRILTLTSLLVFYLLVVSFLHPGVSYSLSEEECRRLQSENLDQGIRCWQDLLGQTSRRKKTLESEIAKFDQQIALTSAQISQALSQIQILQEEIGQLEIKIGHLNLSLDELSRLLIKRIKETYKKQKVNPVFLFFSSADFSDFVSRYQYFKTVQLHDKKILLQMEKARVNYSQQKDLKEQKQVEVEGLKKVLEKAKENLSRQKKEKEYFLEITRSDEKVYQQLLTTAQAEKEALEKAMAQGVALLKDGSPIKEGEAIAVLGNTGAPCCSTGAHLHFEIRQGGSPQDPSQYLKETQVIWDNAPDASFSFRGSWSWPLANPRVTQGFGMTYWARLGWYNGGLHTGIDLTSDDRLIRAPKEGTLYKGETTCGSGCSIKFVAIDHGGLISWFWHVQ